MAVILGDKVLHIAGSSNFKTVSANKMRREVISNSPRTAITIGCGSTVCDAHDANQLRSIRSSFSKTLLSQWYLWNRKLNAPNFEIVEEMSGIEKQVERFVKLLYNKEEGGKQRLNTKRPNCCPSRKGPGTKLGRN